MLAGIVHEANQKAYNNVRSAMRERMVAAKRSCRAESEEGSGSERDVSIRNKKPGQRGSPQEPGGEIRENRNRSG